MGRLFSQQPPALLPPPIEEEPAVSERFPADCEASAMPATLLVASAAAAAAGPDCGGTLPALLVDVCDMAPGLKGPLPADDADDEEEPPEGLNEFSCDPPDRGEGALCDIIDDDDVWPTLAPLMPPPPSNCNGNRSPENTHYIWIT